MNSTSPWEQGLQSCRTLPEDSVPYATHAQTAKTGRGGEGVMATKILYKSCTAWLSFRFLLLGIRVIWLARFLEERREDFTSQLEIILTKQHMSVARVHCRQSWEGWKGEERARFHLFEDRWSIWILAFNYGATEPLSLLHLPSSHHAKRAQVWCSKASSPLTVKRKGPAAVMHQLGVHPRHPLLCSLVVLG